MRTRSDRRASNRLAVSRAVNGDIAIGRLKQSAAEAAEHCACFGVIDRVPSFAVKPAICGHWLEVRRERIETAGGSIYRQVVVPTKRVSPIRNIARGLHVVATSTTTLHNIGANPRNRALA
jgi:hypothetical protein